jgi:sodium-dependent dicarboxylate transporter 2/3/5
VLCVFVMTALLWVFRKDLVIGGFTVPGWSSGLPFAGAIDDGTVAIAMALLLFLIPSGYRGRGGSAGKEADDERNMRRLLGIDVFRKLPWHIVLLFGGGFALAKGFQSSGLSALVGQQFAGLEGSPPLAMVAVVSATLTFMTELTSNTATTELLLPLLASVASATNVHPLLLMIPATLSASCAFMMPVATPPNAIVFGSGRVRIGDMVKIGIVLNLIGIVVITLLFLTLGRAVFDIPAEGIPDWAKIVPPDK